MQQPLSPYVQPLPPRRSHRRLWLILAITGGILVFACIACTVIASFLPKPPQTSSQAIVNTQPVATTLVPSPTATLAPTSTPLPTPTRSEPTITPTPTPASFPATHGRPHIGGPFSDFVGKYGQPIGQGQPGSYNFQSDTARPDGSYPAGPNVTPNAAGMVIGLDIVSDSSSTVSFDQARTHCEVWLPSDAVEFNSAPPYIDYHSSVGEIVMMVNDFGDCVLNIAQS